MSSYQASVPGHVVEAAHQVHKVVAVCQARRSQRVQPPVALLVCGLAVQATCARQKERREQHVARHESGESSELSRDEARRALQWRASARCRYICGCGGGGRVKILRK